MNTLFPPPISFTAFISKCGRCRYSLGRRWSEFENSSSPTICWIMLNPSTADAEQDDPTIRRCIAFSKAWGAGGLVVVNLIPTRCTDPDELLKPAMWPSNQDWLINKTVIAGLSKGRRVIAAWGGHKVIRDSKLDIAVMKHLKFENDSVIECLGTTKDGYPRHPLYVAGKVEPVRYEGRTR